MSLSVFTLLFFISLVFYVDKKSHIVTAFSFMCSNNPVISPSFLEDVSLNSCFHSLTCSLTPKQFKMHLLDTFMTMSWFYDSLLSIFHMITSHRAERVKEITFQFCGLPIFQADGSQRRRITYPRRLSCPFSVQR